MANEKDVALDALDHLERPTEEAPAFVEYDETFAALPSDEAMRQVADLGLKLRRLQRNLQEQEAVVESMKQSIQELEEKTIPDLLLSLGLTAVTLEDGSKLEVADEVYASISHANRPQAFAWLRANKHGDLIKNEIIVKTTKGQDAKAAEALTWLQEQGYDADRTESVHPQTLKAFVKEQDKAGRPVPEDVFAVHRVRKIKVKRG